MNNSYSGFNVGDRIIFEYKEDKVVGQVYEKLNDLFSSMLRIEVHNQPACLRKKENVYKYEDYVDVPSDILSHACPFCGGFGEIVEPAHQHGGEVVDELAYDCKYCNCTGIGDGEVESFEPND